MNKFKIIYLSYLLTIFFITKIAYSESVPIPSKYDSRIQSQYYNLNDVTLIKASVGYLSALNFSNDEIIQDADTGFADGWDLQMNGNVLLVKPISYETDEQTIMPVIHEWDTNLLVTTNKRIYLFALNLVESTDKSRSYLINFKYHDEMNQKILNNEKLKLEKKINIALNKLKVPKNWDYYQSVNLGSENIVPNFVFDDGTFTYFGFASQKNIPAVYSVVNGEEQIVNTNMRMDIYRDYKILVVREINKLFLLRSGNQVVGIINKGYNVNNSSYDETSNPTVIRKVKE